MYVLHSSQLRNFSATSYKYPPSPGTITSFRKRRREEGRGKRERSTASAVEKIPCVHGVVMVILIEELSVSTARVVAWL
jgi:hypothetical protein